MTTSTTTSLTATTPVGKIAASHPLATRVFARYGIDFCCGGGRPLAEVCTAKKLDTDSVLGEIEQELVHVQEGHVTSGATSEPRCGNSCSCHLASSG